MLVAALALTAVLVFVILAVTVAELEPRGGQVRVRADDPHGHAVSADVTLASVAELDLYPGREVHYTVKAAEVTLYPT